MSKCCEFYGDCLFFVFFGSKTVRSINIQTWNLQVFTIFSPFSRGFSEVSFFSYGMVVILRQVFWLYCCLHSAKCSRLLHFLECYWTLSQCFHVLLKQTEDRRELLISCSSSLIIGLISSLKTSRKLDFICPLKVSLNPSTFSSTAALNSSVLRVLSISK